MARLNYPTVAGSRDAGTLKGRRSRCRASETRAVSAGPPNGADLPRKANWSASLVAKPDQAGLAAGTATLGGGLSCLFDQEM